MDDNLNPLNNILLEPDSPNFSDKSVAFEEEEKAPQQAYQLNHSPIKLRQTNKHSTSQLRIPKSHSTQKPKVKLGISAFNNHQASLQVANGRKSNIVVNYKHNEQHSEYKFNETQYIMENKVKNISNSAQKPQQNFSITTMDNFITTPVKFKDLNPPENRRPSVMKLRRSCIKAKEES